MAVGSPPTLSGVQREFGGPSNLRAYYRGGPYVPDTAANAAVSTDPNTLKLSQFAGASAGSPVSISLDRYTVGATATGPSTSGTVGPTTPDVVASGSPTGGTYSWARVGGSTGASPNYATSNARQNWTRINCADSTLYQETWRCTYTVSGQSSYADVTVNHTWFDNR